MAPKDENKQQIDPNVQAMLDAQERQIKHLTSLVETAMMASAGGDGSNVNALLLDRMTQMLEKMTGSQQMTAEIMERAQKHQARPSNTVAPMRSHFNLRGETLDGYTKPRLICEMHVPHRAEDESSTREEVELLNLLTEAPGSYLLTRNDESKVKISVICDMNDEGTKVTRMVWKHDTAFRNEYFRTVPSMAKVIRQFLNQAPEDIRKRAAMILTMQEEQDLIDAGKLAVAV